MSDAPIVELRDVTMKFGEFVALNRINLHVMGGEIVALIGSSGSGKTCVLRGIIGLERIDRGQILIDGQLVAGRDQSGSLVNEKSAAAVRRQRVGMVFQSFNLFPHRTAIENVMEAPVYVQGKSKDEASREAKVLLQRVGLGDRENHFPNQLSGGQQQRVAIARTLATKPDVILFDEVTSALDPELTGEVLSVMFDLAKSGQTMIVVTHEIGFARQVASRVVYMDHGSIIEEGAPQQVIDNPREERTRQFLSKVLRFGTD